MWFYKVLASSYTGIYNIRLEGSTESIKFQAQRKQFLPILQYFPVLRYHLMPMTIWSVLNISSEMCQECQPFCLSNIIWHKARDRVFHYLENFVYYFWGQVSHIFCSLVLSKQNLHTLITVGLVVIATMPNKAGKTIHLLDEAWKMLLLMRFVLSGILTIKFKSWLSGCLVTDDRKMRRRLLVGDKCFLMFS